MSSCFWWSSKSCQYFVHYCNNICLWNEHGACPPHLYKTCSFFRKDYMSAGGSLLLPPWAVFIPSNLFSLPTTKNQCTKQEKQWCILSIRLLLTSHIKGHILASKNHSQIYAGDHHTDHRFNTQKCILIALLHHLQQSIKLYKVGFSIICVT
jgi:hypothetical protein